MSDFAASFERSAFGRRFRFRDSSTTPGRDTVAGMTTFIVMSYIIFVNPAILSFAGVQGLEEGLPFDAVLTSTCLAAGFIAYVWIRICQGQWRRVHPRWLRALLRRPDPAAGAELDLGGRDAAGRAAQLHCAKSSY
jgi:xanthine/uracil/vitamin C permease (AzgA family)